MPAFVPHVHSVASSRRRRRPAHSSCTAQQLCRGARARICRRRRFRRHPHRRRLIVQHGRGERAHFNSYFARYARARTHAHAHAHARTHAGFPGFTYLFRPIRSFRLARACALAPRKPDDMRSGVRVRPM